ncbi:MAG: hypothetical protein AB1540_04060 [Bdellovibrionota bacterium]
MASEKTYPRETILEALRKLGNLYVGTIVLLVFAVPTSKLSTANASPNERRTIPASAPCNSVSSAVENFARSSDQNKASRPTTPPPTNTSKPFQRLLDEAGYEEGFVDNIYNDLRGDEDNTLYRGSEETEFIYISQMERIAKKKPSSNLTPLTGAGRQSRPTAVAPPIPSTDQKPPVPRQAAFEMHRSTGPPPLPRQRLTSGPPPLPKRANTNGPPPLPRRSVEKNIPELKLSLPPNRTESGTAIQNVGRTKRPPSSRSQASSRVIDVSSSNTAQEMLLPFAAPSRGGTRHIYTSPKRPGLLIKILKENRGADSGANEQLIRRELAVTSMLPEDGIPVAAIHSTPEDIAANKIVAELIEGPSLKSFYAKYGDDFRNGKFPRLKAFLDKIESLHPKYRQVSKSHDLQVKRPWRSKKTETGFLIQHPLTHKMWQVDPGTWANVATEDSPLKYSQELQLYFDPGRNAFYDDAGLDAKDSNFIFPKSKPGRGIPIVETVTEIQETETGRMPVKKEILYWVDIENVDPVFIDP